MVQTDGLWVWNPASHHRDGERIIRHDHQHPLAMGTTRIHQHREHRTVSAVWTTGLRGMPWAARSLIVPLWEMQCPQCHTVIEKLYPSFAATESATCAQCHSALVRLPSTGSFVVHGYSAKTNYSRK